LSMLTLASGQLGAMIFGDTSPALLLTFGALLLGVLLVVVAAGLSVVRKSWTPLGMSALNAVVSIVVCYVTLTLDLNLHEPAIALIRGKEAIVAIYEGTQNAATLTLRDNGKMDVFWSGWPGAISYWEGTYQRLGSDIRLHFKNGHGPERLSNRATLADNEVRILDTVHGRTMVFHIVHTEPAATPR